MRSQMNQWHNLVLSLWLWDQANTAIGWDWFIWPPATVDNATTLHTHSRSCMHKEDLLWVSNVWGASIITWSILQVRTQVNLLPHLMWNTAYISAGLHPNDRKRCWNTLYMYEEDLLWVWSVWGASIKTYSRCKQETKWITYYHNSTSPRAITGWSCILMTASHCSRRWNTSYIYVK